MAVMSVHLSVLSDFFIQMIKQRFILNHYAVYARALSYFLLFFWLPGEKHKFSFILELYSKINKPAKAASASNFPISVVFSHPLCFWLWKFHGKKVNIGQWTWKATLSFYGAGVVQYHSWAEEIAALFTIQPEKWLHTAIPETVLI